MIAPTLPKRERNRLRDKQLREGERNLPIDYTQHAFQFTARWFEERNQVTYSTFLPDRFLPDKPWNVLEVGVYEAMDCVWLMQHVLCHPDSRLTAIDSWERCGKISEEDMKASMNRAFENMEPWHGQWVIVASRSDAWLPRIPGDSYDLAIIDGDHRAGPVYQDAVNCLRLVKPGGWLMFDDVKTHKQTLRKPLVEVGLKRFLETHGDQVEFVWSHGFMACYAKRDVNVTVAGKPLG